MGGLQIKKNGKKKNRDHQKTHYSKKPPPYFFEGRMGVGFAMWEGY